jgi:hypothetical protein
VWRNAQPDGDGTRFEFDTTVDGLADACAKSDHKPIHTSWTEHHLIAHGPSVNPAQRTRSGRLRPDAARTGTLSSREMYELCTLVVLTTGSQNGPPPPSRKKLANALRVPLRIEGSVGWDG